MYAHLFPGEGAANDLAAQQLILYLANGVTTVRPCGSHPSHFNLRTTSVRLRRRRRSSPSCNEHCRGIRRDRRRRGERDGSNR
jgi:hypothetical protein